MSKKNNTVVFVLYDFVGQSNNLLSISEGEYLTVDYGYDKFKDWYLATDSKGNRGFVPKQFVQEIGNINSFNRIVDRNYPFGLSEFITKIFLNIDTISPSDAIHYLEKLSYYSRHMLDPNFIKELPLFHLFSRRDVIFLSTIVFIKLETELMVHDNNHRIDYKIYNHIISNIDLKVQPNNGIIGLIINYLDESNKFLEKNLQNLNLQTYLGFYLTLISILFTLNSSSTKSYLAALFSHYKKTKVFESPEAIPFLFKQVPLLPPKLKPDYLNTWFQEFNLASVENSYDISKYQDIFIVLLESMNKEDESGYESTMDGLFTNILMFEHDSFYLFPPQSLHFRFKLLPLVLKSPNFRNISYGKLAYFSMVKIEHNSVEKVLNSLSRENREKILNEAYSVAVLSTNIDNTVAQWDNLFLRYYPQTDLVTIVVNGKGNLPNLIPYICKLSNMKTNTTNLIVSELIKNKCIFISHIVELSIRLPGFKHYINYEQTIQVIANRNKRSFPITVLKTLLSENPKLAYDLADPNKYPEYNQIVSAMEPSEHESINMMYSIAQKQLNI